MKCARCGSPRATNHWELTACADGGKRRSKYLCDHHDAELNEIAMTFLGVRDAQKKASAYRGAALAAHPAADPLLSGNGACVSNGSDGAVLHAAVSAVQALDRHVRGGLRDMILFMLPEPLSHDDGQRLADKIIDLVLATAIPATQQPGAGGVEIRLFDSQWVNVVNAPEILGAESAEDAVNIAVRLTEEGMRKNYDEGKWPAKRSRPVGISQPASVEPQP